MSLELLVRQAIHSLVVHFKTELDSSGYAHVEGRKKPNNDTYPFIEIRIDGPDIETITQNNWIFTFDVNIGIMSERDDTDLYTHTKIKAKCIRAFEKNIHLKAYGLDASQIDCFNRDSDIITTDFDVIQDRILASTVESVYKITLTSE
jgi:hypothetical protein